jgi:hypothetical protein
MECQRLRNLSPGKCGPNYTDSRFPALTEKGKKKRRLRKYVCDKCHQAIDPILLSRTVDLVDNSNLDKPERELQAELDTFIRAEQARKRNKAGEVKAYLEDLVAEYQTQQAEQDRPYQNLMMEAAKVMNRPMNGGRRNRSRRTRSRKVRS